MPPVVHEFVDIHAVEQRERALFGAYEIEEDHRQQRAEIAQGKMSSNGMLPPCGSGTKTSSAKIAAFAI